MKTEKKDHLSNVDLTPICVMIPQAVYCNFDLLMMSTWCSKHVEAWNKVIVKQKLCASGWLITEINILRCTVSKTPKFFMQNKLYLGNHSQLDTCSYNHFFFTMANTTTSGNIKHFPLNFPVYKHSFAFTCVVVFQWCFISYYIFIAYMIWENYEKETSVSLEGNARLKTLLP